MDQYYDYSAYSICKQNLLDQLYVCLVFFLCVQSTPSLPCLLHQQAVLLRSLYSERKCRSDYKNVQSDLYLSYLARGRALDEKEYLMIIFLISHPNHMLWPLIWTVSLRRFRWGVTTFILMQKLRLSLIITKYSLLSRALNRTEVFSSKITSKI